MIALCQSDFCYYIMEISTGEFDLLVDKYLKVRWLVGGRSSHESKNHSETECHEGCLSIEWNVVCCPPQG
jgi:hypothetical protein